MLTPAQRIIIRQFAQARAGPKQDYRGKYSEKLAAKAREQGVTVDHLLANAPKPPISPLDPPETPKNHQKTIADPNLAVPKNSKVVKTTQGLAEILDYEKTRLLDPADISKIWNTYHSSKPMISGSMTFEFYSKLVAQLAKYPVFVLPVPFNDTVEFCVTQYQQDALVFTTLENFKRQIYVPMFTVMHFTEFKDKDLVLMRGMGEMSLDRAQTLLSLVQLYYVSGSEAQRKQVAMFHNNPQDFDYNQLIESLSLLSSTK